MKTINSRNTDYNIDDVFLKRYSPRAMSGENISKEELMTILEAGRWAPSSMNSQPWRFVYGVAGTPYFNKLLSFVLEKNQIWSRRASALIVLISKNTLDDREHSSSHSFDAGSAWENIALQATSIGLITHAMGGIDRDLIKKELKISDDYTIEVMISIGKTGSIEDLPDELKSREKPSGRKNLEEISFEGFFRD